MQQYLAFKSPLVRSLAWILNSPNLLLKAENQSASLVQEQQLKEFYDSSYPYLTELDQNPKPIESWINEFKSYRLGIRFERLLYFFLKTLQNNGTISHLAHNLKILDEHHVSLGEIDLLFFDEKNQKFLHWEIAVKFYCLIPDQYDYQRWAGPNGSDWLNQKVNHMFSRQLGISNTFEAKQTIKNHFGEKFSHYPFEKSALLKGMLFFPLNHQCELNNEEKQLINPDVISGWWTRPEYFYQADTEHVGKWRIIDKLNWITPQFFPYQDDELLTAKEMKLQIQHHFMQSKRSLHLAHFLLDEQTQLWIENKRIFVVHPLWPEFKKPIHDM